MSVRRIAAGLAAAAITATAGLASGPAQATAALRVGTTSSNLAGTVTVSAAASLTDVLPVIAAAFSARYPGVTIRFNFAGSSTLVQQIIAGAPVDVLVTASEPAMQQLVGLGRVGRPLLVARNTMIVVVPKDNPAQIRQLPDLARPGVKVAVCAPAVPCGAAAKDVLANSGLAITPVTQELDVRAVLSKVQSGEVDAGIVYVTDARWAGSTVGSVPIPREGNSITTYPIAVVTGAPNPSAANTFVSYVRYTPSAQGILRAYGFAKPW